LHVEGYCLYLRNETNRRRKVLQKNILLTLNKKFFSVDYKQSNGEFVSDNDLSIQILVYRKFRFREKKALPIVLSGIELCFVIPLDPWLQAKQFLNSLMSLRCLCLFQLTLNLILFVKTEPP
jgi:hypothetical protein